MADSSDPNHHLHDPTLDPKTCARLDRLEEAVEALQNGVAGPAISAPIRDDNTEQRLTALEQRLAETAASPSLDISGQLAAIERAATAEIDAIRSAGKLAVDGLHDLSATINAPAPQPMTVDAMPPAPATPPVSGWIKQITERVDEDMGDADQAVRVEVVRDEKVLTSLEEVGRAEMRYQTALKALNGSTHAQRLMSAAAARRNMAVLDLAKVIVAEHEELERRVMAEY